MLPENCFSIFGFQPDGYFQVGLSVSEKWARQLGYAVSAASADGHVQRAMNEYRPTDRTMHP